MFLSFEITARCSPKRICLVVWACNRLFWLPLIFPDAPGLSNRSPVIALVTLGWLTESELQTPRFTVSICDFSVRNLKSAHGKRLPQKRPRVYSASLALQTLSAGVWRLVVRFYFIDKARSTFRCWAAKLRIRPITTWFEKYCSKAENDLSMARQLTGVLKDFASN